MGIVNISTAIHACYWFYPLMKAIDNEGIEQVSKIKNQYNCPNLYEDKNCYIEEQAFSAQTKILILIFSVTLFTVVVHFSIWSHCF
jgi:hypothetical protein